MMIRSLSLPLTLLLASTLVACPEEAPKKRGPGPQKNEGRVVEIEAVRQGPFAVHGTYPGEFVSDASAMLTSEVAGTVRSLSVRLGDRVEKGAVLASVDAFTYRTRVEELEAEIAVGQAQVEQAGVQARNLESELARKKPLLARQLITEREIEDLQSRIAAASHAEQIARASVDRSQARARSAGGDLADTRIRAPFAGVISERHVDVGTYVGPTQALFSLVDDINVYFRLRVPERDSGQVKVGTAVTLRVEALGGQELTGTVARVAPALDTATRTLRVDVGPTGEAGWEGIKPGMYGQSRILLGERAEALTVSLPSVLRDRDGRRFVWTVIEGKAQRLDVRTGLTSESRIEILEGLAPEQSVVRRGAEQLRADAVVSTVRAEVNRGAAGAP